MTQATVNIIDVVEGAIEVYADQVREQDLLVDLHGSATPVAQVFGKGTHNWRTLGCSDGWQELHHIDDVVVIVPGDGDLTRSLDRQSSGSRQGYIETGRYSTVAEEREMNPGSHA